MPSVTIKLVPFQPAKMDLQGFHDHGCKNIADQLAELGETSARRRKPEYFQAAIDANARVQTDVSVEPTHLHTGSGW